MNLAQGLILDKNFIVILACRRGEAHVDAIGMAQVRSSGPPGRDTIFGIASLALGHGPHRFLLAGFVGVRTSGSVKSPAVTQSLPVVSTSQPAFLSFVANSCRFSKAFVM